MPTGATWSRRSWWPPAPTTAARFGPYRRVDTTLAGFTPADSRPSRRDQPQGRPRRHALHRLRGRGLRNAGVRPGRRPGRDGGGDLHATTGGPSGRRSSTPTTTSRSTSRSARRRLTGENFRVNSYPQLDYDRVDRSAGADLERRPQRPVQRHDRRVHQTERRQHRLRCPRRPDMDRNRGVRNRPGRVLRRGRHHRRASSR